MFREKKAILSAEEIELYREKDETGKDFFTRNVCVHCGGAHARACPRVKTLRFENGKIAEVEFWPPGTWDDGTVIWPEQIYEGGQLPDVSGG